MIEYRPDIDGLRAVAVVPVVLFHAGFPVFSGGYVGVDVFFVISGYLITTIIANDLENRKFSIVSFYERRARRILPALFSVLFVCAVVSYLLMTPAELQIFAKSILSTIFFVSNVFFWTESGYFDTAAEFNPLIHTWSLAVEEQFYIIFPVFLIILYRFKVEARMFVVVAATVGSFLVSVYGVRYHAEASFYLAPTRAWELLVGSLVALGAAPAIGRQWLREAVALTGLALILYGVFTFSEATLFPGEAALAPTIGAALLIVSGQHGSTLVSTCLSVRPVVLVGLVSYSFYLWHWPIFTYYRIFQGRELTLAEGLLLSAAGFFVALLSWRYVEAPWRSRATISSRNTIFAASGAGALVFVGIGLAYLVSGGMPHRVPPEMREMAEGPALLNGLRRDYRCATIELKASDQYGVCPVGNDRDDHPSVLVWGDSHAMASKDGFDAALRRIGIGGLVAAFPGCPPLFGFERIAYGIPCARLNDEVRALLVSRGVKAVVIVGSWDGVFARKNSVFQGKVSFDDETRFENIRDAFSHTIDTLDELGVNVAVMLPVPGAKDRVPETMIRSALLNKEYDLYYNIDEYRNRFSEIIGIVASNDSIEYVIQPADDICRSGRCKIQENGRPYYLDSNHVAEELTGVLADMIEPALRRVVPGLRNASF